MASRQRDRKAEYQRRKERKAAQELAAEQAKESPDEARIRGELLLLERRTKGISTDADADIDFAYRNMALSTAMPLEAPSTAAWSWYIFARNDPSEFLKITQKREDDKTKRAGTITNQRIEDDKRQQFAIIDRIQKELKLDVNATVMDLMQKFPRDVLRICHTKFPTEWQSYLTEECSNDRQ